MATTSQKNRKADPNKTKTGRTRLGPLNLKQLETMLERSNRPKDRAKIKRRIQTLATRKPVLQPTAVAEPVATN
jgi:hypothetical protein